MAAGHNHAPKKVKAPAGMQYVKDPARPGKFKLQPKPGAAPKKPAVNPLDSAVNSAIAAQVKPFMGADASRLQRYEADTADSKHAHDLLQQNLLGIMQTQATANNDALGLAAQRGTAGAERMQANMGFLQSVLGNYVGDQGVGLQGASQHAGVQTAADAAGNTRSVYDAGRASEGNLSQQRGAMVMQAGERRDQLLAKRLEDQRAIQNEIARIRATAPLLKRQFGREDAELQIAQQDLALRRQMASDQRANNEAQIGLGYAGLDAQAEANKPAANANAGKYARFGNVDKKYDAMLDELFKSVASPKVQEQQEDGSIKQVDNPARRFKSLLTTLKGMGLSPGQSALIAASWVPERLKIHGDKSPQVIYKMMRSGELGNKYSDAVIKQVFQTAGLDWNKRTKGGSPMKPKPAAKPQPRPTRPPKLGHSWHFDGSKWVERPSHHPGPVR
jgi:hypothetical protein